MLHFGGVPILQSCLNELFIYEQHREVYLQYGAKKPSVAMDYCWQQTCLSAVHSSGIR